MIGGLGLGYSAMYFGMHRSGAPFEEQGIVPRADPTPATTYVAIGAVSLVAGLAAAHLYNTQR